MTENSVNIFHSATPSATPHVALTSVKHMKMGVITGRMK